VEHPHGKIPEVTPSISCSVRNRNQASGYIEKLPSRSLKNHSKMQTRTELKDRSYREVMMGETFPHAKKTNKAVDTIKIEGDT
jgi:hypothetical protein